MTDPARARDLNEAARRFAEIVLGSRTSALRRSPKFAAASLPLATPERSQDPPYQRSEEFAYSIGHNPGPNILGHPVLTPAVFRPLRVSLV